MIYVALGFASMFVLFGHRKLRAMATDIRQRADDALMAGMSFEEARASLRSAGFNLCLADSAVDAATKSLDERLRGKVEAYFINSEEVLTVIPPSIRRVELRARFDEGRLVSWKTQIRDEGIGS